MVRVLFVWRVAWLGFCLFGVWRGRPAIGNPPFLIIKDISGGRVTAHRLDFLRPADTCNESAGFVWRVAWLGVCLFGVWRG